VPPCQWERVPFRAEALVDTYGAGIVVCVSHRRYKRRHPVALHTPTRSCPISALPGRVCNSTPRRHPLPRVRSRKQRSDVLAPGARAIPAGSSESHSWSTRARARELRIAVDHDKCCIHHTVSASSKAVAYLRRLKGADKRRANQFSCMARPPRVASIRLVPSSLPSPGR
jgi:hypothetical protein